MIEIFIAATFFGTFSLIIDNYRQFLIQQEISENGAWDAELLEVTGKKYMNLKKEPSIEKIMSKGDNEVTLLPDGIKQKYFYIQNCDTEYWRNMNEKSHIIQGRTPNSENEIVVSERFFSENPSYKLGDIVTVTLGKRMVTQILRVRNICSHRAGNASIDRPIILNLLRRTNICLQLR